MLRLIETDLAAARKLNARDRPPAFFLDIRALDPLAREGSYLGLNVVAHEGTSKNW